MIKGQVLAPDYKRTGLQVDSVTPFASDRCHPSCKADPEPRQMSSVCPASAPVPRWVVACAEAHQFLLKPRRPWAEPGAAAQSWALGQLLLVQVLSLSPSVRTTCRAYSALFQEDTITTPRSLTKSHTDWKRYLDQRLEFLSKAILTSRLKKYVIRTSIREVYLRNSSP